MNIERYKKMFDKYIYNFLYFVNHWSTKLHQWSWCKLYSDRRKGYGYKKRKVWDGKSDHRMISIRKRFDEIFKQEELYMKLTYRERIMMMMKI